MLRLGERHWPDAQITASRRVVGESVIPVHGGSLQPGPDAAIIGVAHPKSAQKAKK